MRTRSEKKSIELTSKLKEEIVKILTSTGRKITDKDQKRLDNNKW